MDNQQLDGVERQEADRLDEYWDSLATDAAALAPADLSVELVALSERLHADATMDPAPEFVASLRHRIVGGKSGETAEPRPPRWRSIGPRRRWLMAAPAAAAVLLVAAVSAASLFAGDTNTASAEAILQRVQATAASPQSADIDRLVTTQRYVTYFLGDGKRDVRSAEGESRLWYSAPAHQRVESSYAMLSLDGDVLTEGTSVQVWDGSEYWTYEPNEGTVRLLRQDPDADIYQQGALTGASPGEVSTSPFTSSCRTAETTGTAEMVGRTALVVELGRAHCGVALPGSDGRLTVWVDEETGLILKTETYAADGQLSATLEVTSLELNGTIAPERFGFTPGPGVELIDRRDQPLGVGTVSSIGQPPSVSIDEAREEATFDVLLPAAIPAGFELESVEHYWGNEGARELRSHADWVLLRYADPSGNWLVITQGYGGFYSGLASVAPSEAEQGTVNVDGTEARWVDGSPTSRWQAGTMTLLSWEVASPRQVAMASNTLAVDELVSVAESLE